MYNFFIIDMPAEKLSQGIAVIIAAGLGSILSIAGIALSRFLDGRQREKDFREKLYFESLHTRMTVYEHVINTLSRMRVDASSLKVNSVNDMLIKIGRHSHRLDTLIAKVTLFGSQASIDILKSLRDRIYDTTIIDANADDAMYARNIRFELIRFFEGALSEFTKSTRAEASIKIVDEFVHHSGGWTKMVRNQFHNDKKKQKEKTQRDKNNQS
jgi:hypothetical protein